MVSATGRYHNLGWDRSKAPATKRQRWALWFASGKRHDFRNLNKPLTEEQADEMIKAANRKNAEKLLSTGISIRGEQVQEAFLNAVMKKAIIAANGAGEAWDRDHDEPIFYIYHEDEDVEEPVYGALGDVYIKWPDKRSMFGRYLRANYFDNQYERVLIPHNYIGRREYDLLYACEKAAFDVLMSNQVGGGIKLIASKLG